MWSELNITFAEAVLIDLHLTEVHPRDQVEQAVDLLLRDRGPGRHHQAARDDVRAPRVPPGGEAAGLVRWGKHKPSGNHTTTLFGTRYQEVAQYYNYSVKKTLVFVLYTVLLDPCSRS